MDRHGVEIGFAVLGCKIARSGELFQLAVRRDIIIQNRLCPFPAITAGYKAVFTDKQKWWRLEFLSLG
ncbi:hypothetical protein [Coralliovum pocilloporae]|uniref:hypothetical protein n=1 Tax=Coralliovum pocilloporae TaxID=3066369 RepID=UPI003306F434